MIAVQNLEQRAAELDKMGADYIAVHTGYDLQAKGVSPLESLRTVKSVILNSKVAVAGGIKPDTIKSVAVEQPDLIIVGGGIANADDPKAAAKQCRDIMMEMLNHFNICLNSSFLVYIISRFKNYN